MKACKFERQGRILYNTPKVCELCDTIAFDVVKRIREENRDASRFWQMFQIPKRRIALSSNILAVVID